MSNVVDLAEYRKKKQAAELERAWRDWDKVFPPAVMPVYQAWEPPAPQGFVQRALDRLRGAATSFDGSVQHALEGWSTAPAIGVVESGDPPKKGA